MNTYKELEDGTWVPAIPEPFWYRGLMTWFRWRPSCFPCRKIFKDLQEYEEHYVKMHSEGL